MDTLHEGQKIWVEQADGSQRPGIFVGEAEASWFGGSPAQAVHVGTEVEMLTGETTVPVFRVTGEESERRRQSI
jgi:hypothetical protein